MKTAIVQNIFAVLIVLTVVFLCQPVMCDYLFLTDYSSAFHQKNVHGLFLLLGIAFVMFF